MPTPTGGRGRQRRTVAVLPLINLAAEEHEYLVQTVTEDLVDLLSVVPELRVRPRGETVRFASRSRDVREAGRELGVDVVVDGSLRRVNDLVRVSLRLVTVEDGFQLWARRFDVASASVLDVADHRRPRWRSRSRPSAPPSRAPSRAIRRRSSCSCAGATS